MITLTQPSMALNDSRVFGNYQMWNTWYVRKDIRRRQITNWVASVAKGSPTGKLDNVVINCHGNSGSFRMGKSRFYRRHAHHFRVWRNLVERIWFKSCEVALIEKAGTDDDGNMFISEIAKAANCYVIASTETQYISPKFYPYGQLDSFEGLVLEYGPNGSVTWSKRYGSNWSDNWE